MYQYIRTSCYRNQAIVYGMITFRSAGHNSSAVESVKQYHACVIGMPVKDTIKIADSGNMLLKSLDMKMPEESVSAKLFLYPGYWPQNFRCLLSRGQRETNESWLQKTVYGVGRKAHSFLFSKSI